MKNPKITVYKDTAGEWRWRATAGNGKNVANSGEGYKRRGDCLRGLLAAAKILDEVNVETIGE